MEKTKVFRNLDNIIKYGFIYEQEKSISISIEDILSEVSKSILIYDTKGSVFEYFVSNASKQMNNPNIVFAGLISNKMLQELKFKGIASGFYRSTSKEIDVAVVIVDKTKAFLLVDNKQIIKLTNKNVITELFDYVNHVLWSQAEYEVLNNSTPKKIKEIRLSVVIPSFKAMPKKSELMDKVIHSGTEDFKEVATVFLTKPKVVDKEAKLINESISSLIEVENEGFVKLFDDIYCPIGKNVKQLVVGSSFKDANVASLINKKLWFDGKVRTIESEKEVTTTIYKPVDEYRTFEPNFDQIKNEFVKDIYGEVKIKVDIKPMIIDSSYQLSSKYKKKEEIAKTLSESLNKLKKLVDKDKEKLLDNIIATNQLVEKIKKYNAFISNIEFGDETLKNKRNVVSKINVGKDEISVPQELLGKLYIKSKQQYFAISNEDKIIEAKKWLINNDQEAILVLENER